MPSQHPGPGTGLIPQPVVTQAERHPILRDLFPRSVGSTPFKKDGRTEREVGLPECIIQYVHQGRGWAEIKQKHYTLHAGSVLIIPPQTAHAYGCDPDHPWKNYWTHFRGRQSTHYLKLLSITRDKPVLHLQPDHELSILFENLRTLYLEGHSMKHLVRGSTLLTQILSRLYTLQQTSETRHPTPLNAIETTIQFMQENLNRPISLEALANIACLSRSHYHSLFKQEIGNSPIDYFNQLKIKSACHQLQSTQKSLDIIASEYGFSNAFYFSRIFKKVMGMPPSHYRKQPLS